MNIHPFKASGDNISNSAGSIVRESSSPVLDKDAKTVPSIERISNRSSNTSGSALHPTWSSNSSFSLGNVLPSVASCGKRKGNRTRKSAWSEMEDNIIISLVSEAGTSKPNWPKIANEINSFSNAQRKGKQCRERYLNHLRPDIKKGGWTKEEEEMIRYYHQMFGNKWSAMAQVMKNRTDNDIKNKFYSMNRSAKRKKKCQLAGSNTKESRKAPPAAAAFQATGWQQSFQPYSQLANTYFDNQPAFGPPQRQQTLPLYAGDSLFRGIPLSANATCFGEPSYEQYGSIVPTVTDGGTPGGIFTSQYYQV
ncbi:Myb-like DNA-binding protein [Nitzschia inconspicua]|uniref:Myb-like DNA-binding protein n=1 Tax=Nitzschia inconspicua TaxID=303405 RepID=A0A9K3LI75_9STRA|nr:Myb-like DNA-binding protein [Nitzschia inconspicua]KAG7362265.1 Myb-like DNA-binding protein [Nitzschia inconspicua]